MYVVDDYNRMLYCQRLNKRTWWQSPIQEGTKWPTLHREHSEINYLLWKPQYFVLITQQKSSVDNGFAPNSPQATVWPDDVLVYHWRTYDALTHPASVSLCLLVVKQCLWSPSTILPYEKEEWIVNYKVEFFVLLIQYQHCVPPE